MPKVWRHSYCERETVEKIAAAPFDVVTSHIAHWIPEFVLVVAGLGELLKSEGARFRGESATQNQDTRCRDWKQVHSL